MKNEPSYECQEKSNFSVFFFCLLKDFFAIYYYSIFTHVQNKKILWFYFFFQNPIVFAQCNFLMQSPSQFYRMMKKLV